MNVRTLSDTPTLPHPARRWRELCVAYFHDPADPRVDTAAVNMLAALAPYPNGAHVCVLREGSVERYFGLVYVLAQYGMKLLKKHRKAGGVLVTIKLEETPAPFQGAIVRAKPAPLGLVPVTAHRKKEVYGNHRRRLV